MLVIACHLKRPSAMWIFACHWSNPPGTNARRPRGDFYPCRPPDRIRHKCFFFYSRDFGEREVAHESRLVRCWSMVVIGSQGAMWTILAFSKSPGTYARWPCWSLFHETQMFSAMWIYTCHWSLPGTYARWPRETGAGANLCD